MDTVASIGVEVQPLADADAGELAQLVGELRAELLDTDVDRVDLWRGIPPPTGAKAIDAVAAGRLVVGLARSAPRLRAVVTAIARWVASRPVRSVKIQIDGDVLEVTGIDAADQRALMDVWIARHAGRPATDPA
jgi:hypothetical protein